MIRYSIFIISAWLFFFQVHAQELTVATDKSGNYTKIQDAIDAAVKGTTIRVKPGRYHENITMKPGIVLLGNNYNSVIDGGGTGCVVQMADSCEIANFTITNSGDETGINDCGILIKDAIECKIIRNLIVKNGHYGIVISNASVDIRSNVITKNAILGIYIDDNVECRIAYNLISNHVHSALDIPKTKELHGSFHNNNVLFCENGISYQSFIEQPLDFTIYNNIFYENNVAVNCPYNFVQQVEYNLFHNNEKDFYDWYRGSSVELKQSNISGDPLFSNMNKWDYTLRDSSPCINAGKNNTDIGAVQYHKSSVENTEETCFSGVANNITANRSAGVYCTIKKYGDNEYQISGAFDNTNLYGSFNLSGKRIRHWKKQNINILQFTGNMNIGGNDNSGFSENTKIRINITLRISSGGADGIYHIEPIGRYIEYPQYGTLRLYYTDKQSKYTEF